MGGRDFLTMSQITVSRLYNDQESHDKIINWAHATLTPEELTDFNLALQRNTEKHNYLLANNLVTETPILENFYSDALQSNVTLPVGDSVTYNVSNDNVDKFQIDTRWAYYLARYLEESA